MRKTFSLLTAFLFITSVFIAAGFAQDEVTSRYSRGKMIEASDLMSSAQIGKCATPSNRYAGTVSAVVFSSGKIIDNFTVRTAKGAVNIHLSPELYDSRISKQDAIALPSLVAKGRKITVDAYRCGRVLYANYILSGIELETLGMVSAEF